ncbi:mannosyl-oligosaccharide alpha-1,2-mannosidase [Cladophialophora yegresii CBS 114405]|uniref:alpha-1,2-Mannosidase n=1 Tax=Cladophialophora yegresii CBS 114405 TaxID=1182544 RepID=W9W5E9_9EURO|nr:mannosyl-oligosaccharide alpha-1,2-mannosidase [Cladophialophora yegresii CBS 114405]EXJ60225.1 mannosyl-oligosaccharide alpha-1,2-mannosidase [Cladophialophora yegresii CBS 114405]
MMRLRRYRLFLVVALFAVVLVYHLSSTDAWDSSSFEALVGLGSHHAGKLTADTPAQPFGLPVTPREDAANRPVQPPHPALPPNELRGSAPSPSAALDTASLSTSPEDPPRTVSEEELLTKQTDLDEFGAHDAGQAGIELQPVEQESVRWQQQKEHFPIPSHSMILLPTGEPKALPQVQFHFVAETSTRRRDRIQKQTVIREAFKHAWFGYKNYSLPHDELKPLSKDVGDPFNGWGATLVDSLDSLWIMGLYDEFADAVEEVSKIDFRTSTRKDIPLFETVIRYLGGLIAAYDLSSGKYPVLLDKAVDLADILMGAFDTPNRMPAVFYKWAPFYASQPHRASPHSVLAEIGSLSVEFTRLAQITKEPKYYDAVARVTNALEDWQMKTSFPGLWPLKLDASGCKKPEKTDRAGLVSDSVIDADDVLLPESVASEVLVRASDDSPSEKRPATEFRRSPEEHDVSRLNRRQQLSSSPPREQPLQKNTGETGKKLVGKPHWTEDDFDDVDCEPQGLSTEPQSKTHTYGIGSMADSTYEYFPKEYALLGGLNSQYKSMYLNSLKVVREELLFRPMTKQNHDILFLAKQNILPGQKDPTKRTETFYEGTHLGCYAGGMFALGSRLFNLPSDMAIAEKLTDGCVWAYGSTPAGVMPEEFELVPCDSLTSCHWNETKWHEALDPRRDDRMQAAQAYNGIQQRLYKEVLGDDLDVIDEEEQPVPYSVLTGRRLKRRDSLTDVDEDSATHSRVRDESDISMSSLKPSPFVPMAPLSHEKYVAAKIQEQRIPPGYTKIQSRDYRLRPEAIESVFIMYRLTGDETWRDKGWAMFGAVDRATKTEIANAGIKDVTSLLQEQQDTMESFWLAETLKYYYLLFSEPDLISLDDYVL